jgi:hypothetical protein
VVIGAEDMEIKIGGNVKPGLPMTHWLHCLSWRH